MKFEEEKFSVGEFSTGMFWIIRTQLYESGWNISSGRLDNLIKYEVWRRSNKLVWSIYQLIFLSLRRNWPSFG